MGAFFNSFWREMGRNTGKRVSNAVYGDKWSTPYRFSGRGRGYSSNRAGSGGCMGCLAWPFKLIGYIFAFPFLVLYYIYIVPIKWLINRLRS